MIDLDSPLRLRGRSRSIPPPQVIRALTPADLALLDTARGSKPSPLKRLRDSHHRLARVLATGVSQTEAAARCGMSISRVSILLADHSFADLVEVYRSAATEAFADYADMALGNMARAEVLVEDALESAADGPPLTLPELRPLLDLIDSRADRFGFPRATQSTNLNVSFAGRLESARKRSGLALPAGVAPSPPGPRDEP